MYFNVFYFCFWKVRKGIFIEFNKYFGVEFFCCSKYFQNKIYKIGNVIDFWIYRIEEIYKCLGIFRVYEILDFIFQQFIIIRLFKMGNEN